MHIKINQGQIQDFWKVCCMYKGMGVCFADFTNFLKMKCSFSYMIFKKGPREDLSGSATVNFHQNV